MLNISARRLFIRQKPVIPEIPGGGANGIAGTFSGISSRNFGCTSRSWPKIVEDRITGQFRSIRPFMLGPSFSGPGNRTQHGGSFLCSISALVVFFFLRQMT